MKSCRRVIGLMLLLTLCGCWGQVDIEQVGPILQVGVEDGGRGRILVTHSFPALAAVDKNRDELVSMKCAILRESREIWRKKSPQLPQGGLLQQFMFSKDFARGGIYPWLEVFQRDPINPPNANIVIVDGSPKQLMEKAARFKDKPRPALYIQSLLKNNDGHYTALTNIFQFNILYYAPGVDAATSLIKLEPRAIRLTGMALFSKDRMVGSIDTDQAILLLAMMGRLRDAECFFPPLRSTPESAHRKPIAAALISVKQRKIITRIKEGQPDIEINLTFSGVLDEYRWDRMDRPQSQQILEQGLGAELTRRAKLLILYMQRVGSDPIGIGDRIRAECPVYWRSHPGEQIFRAARIKVNIHVGIVKYGVIK